MLSVGADPVVVERQLRSGGLRCPQCGGRLTPWGHAALRFVRRAAGDLHHQALRALGNRLVGILHGCLRHHTQYDEHKAWAHRTPSPASNAA